MKYAVFAALAASTRGAIFDACTDTWDGATGCDTAAGEQCFDWQDEGKTKSNGLKCGEAKNCDTTFKYTDTAGGGSEVTYYGNCKGLSLSACTFNGTECDSLAGFKCADWTQADGTNTVGCAQGTSECGKEKIATKYDVACTGLAGETCTGDSMCDPKVNRCTQQFNNQTYTFMNKTNVCMGKDMCGKSKNATDKNETTIYLCFNETGTPCSANKTCEKPNGDEKDVACGYLAPGGNGSYNMSGGMCVDNTMCSDAAKNGTGAVVTYFGGSATLWCGSARTALAMGAAVASAYLAM